jgi:hypothetical protein
MCWNLAMLAEYGSNLYKLTFLLHMLVAIVGLGAVMLNGLYAAQAQQRQGPPSRAIAEANFAVTKVAEYFIYAIPVFGILLVLESNKLWKFSQTWVWLALVVYAIAIGISHGVMFPGTKRVVELMKEMESSPPPAGGAPPQVAELQAVGKRLATGGMILDLIVVVLLYLMIFKPGL